MMSKDCKKTGAMVQVSVLLLMAIGMAGCSSAFWKPASKSVAPTGGMEKHESWCYSSLGYAECYAHPLDETPGRLINVDPPSRYPMTGEEYEKAVAKSH